MQALLVSTLVFVGLFGGAIGAMLGARRLKQHHLSKETQEAVKLGVGMVAAMASLILGLMTASVKGNFDSTSKDVQQYATYLVTLDSVLRDYGPDAAAARKALLVYTRSAIAETWPAGGDAAPLVNSIASGRQLSDVGRQLRGLNPQTPAQTELRAEAISRYQSLTTLRWTLIAESATQIPTVFTVVLVVWLILIFVSFGLFAPINAVSLVVFPLCCLSLAGAIFLILEMSSPFSGIIVVAPDAMQNALQHMEM
ncbi:hypothetical protein ACI7BZ_02435 [Xanthobacter sp. AM11]|uniref:bestrophin-like domain n=1 Tax=Xanthobacter sp. AM11 TaxID=3380643 RepID=UPI0039BFB454